MDIEMCYNFSMMNTSGNRGNNEQAKMKICANCGKSKPVSEFLRRTGRRELQQKRRGTCRQCRQAKTFSTMRQASTESSSAPSAIPVVKVNSNRKNRRVSQPRRMTSHHDDATTNVTVEQLRATWRGVVRLRGMSDTGRRWYQEVDPEQAKVLVREGAADIINHYTIKMIYSNKELKRYILTRDHHQCYYCGSFGDTIDHLIPRSKGGYTTPVNCVCACLRCNQLKANQTVEQFQLEQQSNNET